MGCLAAQLNQLLFGYDGWIVRTDYKHWTEQQPEYDNNANVYELIMAYCKNKDNAPGRIITIYDRVSALQFAIGGRFGDRYFKTRQLLLQIYYKFNSHQITTECLHYSLRYVGSATGISKLDNFYYKSNSHQEPITRSLQLYHIFTDQYIFSLSYLEFRSP